MYFIIKFKKKCDCLKKKTGSKENKMKKMQKTLSFLNINENFMGLTVELF